MGEVKVEVRLENAVDRELAYRGQIGEDQVRKVTLPIVADTGAVMLCLPQEVAELLGLREKRTVIVRYADGRKEERPVAGLVTVYAANRSADVECIVGAPNSEPLLGQIVLAATDLLVDSSERALVPRPESPLLPLLNVR